MKTRLFSLFLAVFLFSLSFVPTVNAAEPEKSNTEIVYLDNGYYCVFETIEGEAQAIARSTTYTKSGSRTAKMYNSSDELLVSLTVHGSFSYNGATATATSASYTYSIEKNSWKFDSGNASRSGATVTATATFKYLLIFDTETLTVSLTCSPTGVLS